MVATFPVEDSLILVEVVAYSPILIYLFDLSQLSLMTFLWTNFLDHLLVLEQAKHNSETFHSGDEIYKNIPGSGLDVLYPPSYLETALIQVSSTVKFRKAVFLVSWVVACMVTSLDTLCSAQLMGLPAFPSGC